MMDFDVYLLVVWLWAFCFFLSFPPSSLCTFGARCASLGPLGLALGCFAIWGT